MSKHKLKNIVIDLLADFVGGLLISIGVYNFAVASEFPVAGVSGIAVLCYHFWKVPIGTMTIILNIPIVILCYKVLGHKFLFKSFRTMIISMIAMDVIAPLFPVYRGEMILSCICMGLFAGLGFAVIYMRDTSTGGADFVIMAIRAWKPYLSIGRLIMILDFTIVLVSGFLMSGNVDKIIYGLIATYILSMVVDKAMYGIDAGKLTLVVTEHGQEVADRIDELTQRGSTLLKAEGSYTQTEKQVVMCACNNKEMHMVQKAVKEADKDAFLVTMESNEVRGNGFKPH